MSKKSFKSVLSLFLAVLLTLSLAVIPSSAVKAALNKSSVTLVKGHSTTLSVNGTNQKVTWSSADESIATVSKRGKVTAQKLGTTIISASFGKSTLKCEVTVKAGSVATSGSDFDVEVGKTITVSIKAVGLHDLEVKNLDSSVAKATLSGKYDGDRTKIDIKGLTDGKAKIKIYAKGYENSIYKYIIVTVGKGKPTKKVTVSDITVSADSIEVNENCTTTVTVNAPSSILKKLTFISTSKYKFDIETTYKTDSAVIKIKGYAEGNANLRIFDPNDKKTDIYIPVTVTNNAYDVVVWNREPKKRKNTDVIYSSSNNEAETFYVLEPSDADPAHAESLVSKKSGKYKYWTIYESRPLKADPDDVILSRFGNYNGKKVIRYILVEKDYDEAYTNSAFGKYFGEYEYYKVYVTRPSPSENGNILFIYKYSLINLIGEEEKKVRYILVPYNFDITKVNNAWNSYAEKHGIEDWELITQNVTIL